ncbi:MAG: protein kinase [Planctomyces sp.]|nr:protein kinase [Planctomyces sp.]
MRTTLDTFVATLERSELLDPAAIQAALSQWRAGHPKGDEARHFAEHLCRTRQLSVWQAEKLLQGKHRGFHLGRYRLHSMLGKGGMSSVYLAQHTVMKRFCAVKVLPAKKARNPGYITRFHREARAVAALDHPNIVRAYDIDQSQDGALELHFLVMEYVQGKTLFELIRSSGPLPVAKAADYVRQASLGLEHAHRAGLIHRDVKPENLILDRQGVIKVMDLGLARFFESNEEQLTVHQDERVLGTANYCSPEQAIDSHSVDARSDIYSLGCTLYYLLMGHPPFNSGTLAQRLIAHQTREPPSISEKRLDVPEELIEIVRKMMRKRPEDRYASTGEVAEALDAFLKRFAAQKEPAPRPASAPVSGAATPESSAPAAPPPGDSDEFQIPDFEAIERARRGDETDTVLESPTPFRLDAPPASELERFFEQISDSDSSPSTVHMSDGPFQESTAAPAAHPTDPVTPRPAAAGRAGRSSSSGLHRAARSNPGGVDPARKQRQQLQAAGAVAITLLIGWLGLNLLGNRPPARPAVSAADRELTVGPTGHFATVTEALDAIAARSLEARVIRLAPGATSTEAIRLNGKGRGAAPRGLRILGDPDSPAILKPAHTGEPIAILADIEDLVISNVVFDAAGGNVALRVSGFLVSSRLQDITVRGFLKTGIEAQNLDGFPDQEVRFERVTVQENRPEAVAIRCAATGADRTGEIDFQGVRLIGPLAAGIEFSGPAWNVSIERCILDRVGAGIRFAQTNQDVRGVTISQNTFHRCDTGVLFVGLPAGDSGPVEILRNLFALQEGAEVRIDGDVSESWRMFLEANGNSAADNWSDRLVPDEPVPGEIDIFETRGRRGATLARFQSTDPKSALYLKPNTDALRIDGGFIGAVEP